MAGTHGTRMLWLYAGMVTALLLTAFTRGPFRGHEFDEIIVHRIKVAEPDGTLRMVISNHDKFSALSLSLHFLADVVGGARGDRFNSQ